MLNYLIKLNLLPQEFTANPEPEIMLNELGNPYLLRAKALDEPLTAFELGRVFDCLTAKAKEQIEEIIFKQRSLRLNADCIGKCSLEPSRKRARVARLESQRFRYLQDINNLQYLDYYTDKSIALWPGQTRASTFI